MTQLVTLSDNSNFAQLAAAMGMSADVKKDSKANTLARLKIDTQASWVKKKSRAR